VKPLEDLVKTCSCSKEWLEDSDSKPDYWEKNAWHDQQKNGENTAKTKFWFCLIFVK
jgi:hypothetical protein